MQTDEDQGAEQAALFEGDAKRRILAIGGGKGGVGKSLIAANLGIYLAQRGKRVILVDADLGGANLHTFVGVERPARTLGEFFEKQVENLSDCLVETAVQRLSLISGEGDAPSPRQATTHRLIAELSELDADYVIIDLPPGSSPLALDLFLAAEVGVLVVVPEPTSVENTYRFLKSAFLRGLRHERPKSRPLPRSSEGGLPSPLDVYAQAKAESAELGDRVKREIQKLRPRLIVNQPRARGDLELGAQIRSAGRRRLGLHIDYLGHLESDDAVWQAVRKRRPLIVDHPESKVAKNLERIARKLMSADHERVVNEEPLLLDELSLYEVLEIEPGASDEEIRRAVKRARDLYTPDSLAIWGLFASDELGAQQRRLDEAYDVLLDAERRHAYDLQRFPDGVFSQPVSEPAIRPRELGRQEAQTRLQLPQPELDATTEFSGALLKRLRETAGVELLEIAERSKIGIAHLRAIEAENWKALPAPVYLRGFLVEYARFLRLDIALVVQTFFARYEQARIE